MGKASCGENALRPRCLVLARIDDRWPGRIGRSAKAGNPIVSEISPMQFLSRLASIRCDSKELKPSAQTRHVISLCPYYGEQEKCTIAPLYFCTVIERNFLQE